MRASLPLLLIFTALACGPTMTTQPAADPAPAMPIGPSAESTAPATDSAPASAEPAATAAPECRKDDCRGKPDAGPPPLRGSSGGPGAFTDDDAGAQHEQPCKADTVEKELQAIVDACRGSSRSICGDVVVHTASGDAGADNVSADFNLGTSGDTLGFSKCVLGRINSVKWQCAERGKDIHLDLGCRL